MELNVSKGGDNIDSSASFFARPEIQGSLKVSHFRFGTVSFSRREMGLVTTKTAQPHTDV